MHGKRARRQTLQAPRRRGAAAVREGSATGRRRVGGHTCGAGAKPWRALLRTRGESGGASYGVRRMRRGAPRQHRCAAHRWWKRRCREAPGSHPGTRTPSSLACLSRPLPSPLVGMRRRTLLTLRRRRLPLPSPPPAARSPLVEEARGEAAKLEVGRKHRGGGALKGRRVGGRLLKRRHPPAAHAHTHARNAQTQGVTLRRTARDSVTRRHPPVPHPHARTHRHMPQTHRRTGALGQAPRVHAR